MRWAQLNTDTEIATPKQAKQRGFTIVELLIVIVVIAILAAISVVAYTGIQNRARAAQLDSDISNVAKSLELYRVDHGKYPITNEAMISFRERGVTVGRHSSIPNTFLYCVDHANPQQWTILAYGYPASAVATNQRWTSPGQRTSGVSMGSAVPTCQAELGGAQTVTAAWAQTIVQLR